MPHSALDVLVVAHTHWDREWYHTAERFRQRLVALVDELLDDPPSPGESFLLDGQAILLEDYLEVRPERAGELSTLLREGRLEAGPWYVLADELIPSAEALVRNLLAGRRAVRRLRGEPPPVLYCPDSFGHPAALPELASGFGCGLVVLWRGYGGTRWPSGDTVRWRGPSGATVTMYHLPPDGYEFGSALPTGEQEARGRWREMEQVLEPRAATGVVLLLNGADHHARQRDQGSAVRALAAVAAPTRVLGTTLHAAGSAILSAASTRDLPIVEGELRDSYGYAWTLQGTLGARAEQKRRNARAERTLVRDVEPWIALAPEGGNATVRALLRVTWRTLLRGHPHDTLCGTSIDAVAAAFDGRLAAAEVQAHGLREDALYGLAGHDRERARTTLDGTQPVVMLRNPAARRRGGVAELTLSTAVSRVAVGPASAGQVSTVRRPPPWRVNGMPLQILERRERVALTESPRAYPRADRVAEIRALGWVSDMPGYAVETRSQRGAAPASGIRHPVRADGQVLDNGLLRVSVDQAGVVRLEELTNGRTVDALLALEQREEGGDLYTPSPGRELPAPRLLRVRTVHRGPLRGEVAIDVELGEGTRGRGRCRLSVQLDADLPAVRVAVHGDNRSGDHRLRLRVATGLAGATTLADAAFHPVVRRAPGIPVAAQHMERAVATAPLHRWVARFGPGAGATIFSDGLAEYESLEDGAVAITLIRAVGVLSRADLAERPGHAGWPADTPAAQTLGPYAARFAVALHGTDTPAVRDEIERLADDVLLPIVGETLRSNLDPPQVTGGLQLDGEGMAFSAAAPAERGEWIMLRCVNRRDHPTRGRWRMSRTLSEAVRARLDETPLEPLVVDGDAVSFDAGPREIVTILVR